MIDVTIYSKLGTKNITHLVKSLSWSGDINTLPRTVELEIQNSNNLPKGQKLIYISVGEMMIIKYDSNEIFRGFVFRQRSSANGEESITLYDELIYAVKNNDSLIIRDKTASQVITNHMKKFGIAIGSIEPTTYKLPRSVYQNQGLAEIWKASLDFEKKKTGKSFHIFSSRGLVYMWKRAKAAVETISITSVISGSKEISIEDLKTQILLTKGNPDPASSSLDDKDFVPYTTKLISSSTASDSYGIMQHVEEVDEKTTDAEMKNIGNSLLAQLSQPTITSDIEFLGNVKCITGRMVEVSDTQTGITGKFYITADTHTFSDGTHKMTLQLSKNLE